MVGKSKTQKRKSDEENRIFQERWRENYCSAENKCSIICTICKQSVSVPKDNNSRHIQTKHLTRSLLENTGNNKYFL